VLILGGRDKGNDYSLIENEVKKYVKLIVAVGESKNKIYNYFKDIKAVSVAQDFNDAFNKAVANAKKGDVVLLSPACSSFDMFENFEHRGNEFKKLVNKL
ncbi:MAG: glutamate ligase domain-containing protein, partial [Ignavibacteria bacterium]